MILTATAKKPGIEPGFFVVRSAVALACRSYITKQRGEQKRPCSGPRPLTPLREKCAIYRFPLSDQSAFPYILAEFTVKLFGVIADRDKGIFSFDRAASEQLRLWKITRGLEHRLAALAEAYQVKIDSWH